MTSPVVDCGTIFVGTTNGIAARRLTDGAPLWQTTTATPAQPLLLAGSTLATITCSNELMLFDSQSGRVQATIPGVLAAQPPLLTREQLCLPQRTRSCVFSSANVGRSGG